MVGNAGPACGLEVARWRAKRNAKAEDSVGLRPNAEEGLGGEAGRRLYLWGFVFPFWPACFIWRLSHGHYPPGCVRGKLRAAAGRGRGEGAPQILEIAKLM